MYEDDLPVGARSACRVGRLNSPVDLTRELRLGKEFCCDAAAELPASGEKRRRIRQKIRQRSSLLFGRHI